MSQVTSSGRHLLALTKSEMKIGRLSKYYFKTSADRLKRIKNVFFFFKGSMLFSLMHFVIRRDYNSGKREKKVTRLILTAS